MGNNPMLDFQSLYNPTFWQAPGQAESPPVAPLIPPPMAPPMPQPDPGPPPAPMATPMASPPEPAAVAPPTASQPIPEPATSSPAMDQPSPDLPPPDFDYDSIIPPEIKAMLEGEAHKKPSWGKGIAIGALMMSNPQVAMQLLSQDYQSQEHAKSMLTQLGIQEAAGKRDWNRQKVVQRIADEKIKAAEDAQVKRAENAARAQIEADARDAELPVELGDLPWDTNFDKARVDATSRINTAKGMGNMVKEMRKGGYDLSGLDLKPTPENYRALQARYDIYDQDFSAIKQFDKLYSTAANGFSPDIAKAFMGNLKTPEAKTQVAPFAAAGVQRYLDHQRELGFRQTALNSAQTAGSNAKSLLQARIDEIKDRTDDIANGRVLADANAARQLADQTMDTAVQVTKSFGTAALLGQNDPTLGALYSGQGLELQALLGRLQDATNGLMNTVGEKNKQLKIADPKATFDEALATVTQTAMNQKDADGNPTYPKTQNPMDFLADQRNVTDPYWKALVQNTYALYKNKMGDKANDKQFSDFITGLSIQRSGTLFANRPTMERLPGLLGGTTSASEYVIPATAVLDILNSGQPTPTPPPAP